jgi:hypothetical protein
VGKYNYENQKCSYRVKHIDKRIRSSTSIWIHTIRKTKNLVIEQISKTSKFDPNEYLDIGDCQTEEQVHDDDRDQQHEDCDQDVSRERKELRFGFLVNCAAGERPVYG